MLGAIVAAGFYKFIKVLEYETANPDQDSDRTANVQRRKKLLLAAGINEYDAHKVAEELTEKTAVAAAGGPDGNVVANGQGRTDPPVDTQGMYGTQFRRSSTRSSVQTKRTSEKFEDEYAAPYQAQRPQATTTGSQIGRFSYLGNRGAAPGDPANVHALAQETRLDSPAMMSNDQLYAPLAHGADVPLGGSVHSDLQEPRQRFGRTPSSYA